MRRKLSSTSHTLCHRVVLLLLLCGAWVLAEDDAVSRFKGTGKVDPIRIENAKWEASDIKGEGVISFDLAWDHSWRAAWEVAEAQHGGKGALKVENWDAAWLFVKILKPGAQGWQHATLSPNSADHVVPDGAKLDTGLSDDGQRGLGVFVYRSAPGSGANNWKNVKLRWRQAADGIAGGGKVIGQNDTPGAAPQAQARKPEVKKKPASDDIDALANESDDSMAKELDAIDAAKSVEADKKSGLAQIRLYAVRMVYVPECAFWVGDGSTNPVAGQLSAGDSSEPFRIESEAALTLGGVDPKNLGNRDNLFAVDDFSTSQTRSLPAAFPKGYGGFYCMRHEVTRGDMVAFLNSLSPDQQAAMKEFYDENGDRGNQGIRSTGSGLQTKFVADRPDLAREGMAWRDSLAYAAWSGLRPMTELEFEKACRGPLKPVADEYAWGTAKVVGAGAGKGRYTVKNAGAADESVVWEGENAPDATRGNAGWSGNLASGPLRAGGFATPNSDRVSAGASYWGILDLTGNVGENTVAVGRPIGRQFTGTHGGGEVGDIGKWSNFNGMFDDVNRTNILDGLPGWWLLSGGMIFRGIPNDLQTLRVADRSPRIGGGQTGGLPAGFRAVRSVGAGRTPAAAGVAGPSGAELQDLFNASMRVGKVTVTQRDPKTATLTFDVAWSESWRNATNYDAAWVFFKTRAAGKADWKHVKLVADKITNPTGYGQGSGTHLEFVVPDGPDGFTGVFLQRAEPGNGPLAAKGVTVLAELAAPAPDLVALAIEMVQVPEGPFYLGSGGTEENRFYQYTDGSQDTLPYQVTDAGPIPTGPQEGRLWATGVQPDGTDAGEIPAVFPNGYRAFYCMKRQLRRGQMSAFLGMQSVVRSFDHAWRSGDSLPLAKRAWAFLMGVTWEQGAAFGAWSGLRPMTELEFEKACRGPLKSEPNEIGPGYCGILELSLGGLVQYVVSVGKPEGLRFAGRHGMGTTEIPADWPQGTSPAIARRGGDMEASSSERLARTSWRNRIASSSDMDGWRGVRTAPNPKSVAAGKQPAKDFALALEPIPAVGAADLAAFYLAGRVSNALDQAVQVELASSLPDSCFPEGAATRTISAAAKAATPFKVLTVATFQTLRNARRGQLLPVRVRKAGGDVLAETMVRLPLADPLSVKAQVIKAIEGGKVSLRMLNTTDRALALTLDVQAPASLVVAEAKRRVDLAVDKKPAELSFTVSRSDASVMEGFYRIPYRLSGVDGNATQAGDLVIELRAQSRWWVNQRENQAGKPPEVGDSLPAGLDDADGALTESAAPKENVDAAVWNLDPSGVFKSAGPPAGWKAVTHGAALWPGQLTPQPKAKTILSAATRVVSPADRDAILKIGLETDGWTWLDGQVLATIDAGSSPGYYPPPMRVWINGELARDTRRGAKPPPGKSVSLKKGVNTLLMQFETEPIAKGEWPSVFPLFSDAKDGSPIRDLSFDVEVKQ